NCTQAALLVIDADNFKNINDLYGHHAGDKALTAIVSALRSSLRVDDLIGRIGGEEFAVFLSNTDMAEAQNIAEQLRKSVEAINFTPLPDQP
ncbi:GGDEF domain-containing protein, partial [Salmonella enterica]|nr:GGDEF domain-containing protein [Salmonella enterica]